MPKSQRRWRGASLWSQLISGRDVFVGGTRLNFFEHFVGVFVFSWKRENRKLSRLSLELQDIRNPKKHLSRMEVISYAKKEIRYYHRIRCYLIVFSWDVLRQTQSTNRLNCVSRNSGCSKYLFSKRIASPPLNLLYYSLLFLKESLMMKVFCGFLFISIVNSKKNMSINS